MSTVSVIKIRNNNIQEGVRSAIEKAGNVQIAGKKVLIKPNLVDPRSPGSGDITNPKVVGEIIRYCQERRADKIIVGEGPSYYQPQARLKECFTRSGTAKVAEQHGVKWLVFDDYSYRSFRNFSPSTPSEFKVTEFVFSSDVIINVPVMKTHFMSTVTLAMKNLKGCLRREYKPKFHRNLARAVVQLNKIIRPHLNIVDGTVVKDNPPVLVAGSDIVAVDSVASRIMGFQPETIDMIRFGQEEGLGEMELDRIRIEGEDLSGLNMNLEVPSKKLAREFPSIEFGLEEACCGCLIPILSSLSELREEGKKATEPFLLVAGEKDKRPDKQKNVLFIGNCTREIAEGSFLEGCPPKKNKIKEAFSLKFENSRKDM